MQSMNKERPKAARKTQARRRSESQALILSASLHSLAEKGYAGFSASGVAAMAGVSRGAQEHYFRTKGDLIAAATRLAMAEAVEYARTLAQTATQSADPIDKFLADSEHFFFTPVFQAMIEIMIAGRSNRALSRIVNPIVLDARQALNNIWTDRLGAAGYPRASAQQFIELTHYLLRGVFLVSNWLPYPIDRSEVIDVWRRAAPAILKLGVVRRRSTGRRISPRRRILV
jgi:AcrR family transcriptional regulator